MSAEDRASYRPTNRMQAVAKARGRKGQLAWDNKVQMGKQEQTPGTGGFTSGIALQQARLREEGAKVQRSKALRPEKPVY